MDSCFAAGVIAPQVRIQSLLLVKCALSDDDADVRILASGIVSSMTASEYALCRDRAVHAWWKYMERFGNETYWQLEIFRHIHNSKLIGQSNFTILDSLPAENRICSDRTLETISHPDDDLFASEPPNLFNEPVTELAEAVQGYMAVRDQINLAAQENDNLKRTIDKLADIEAQARQTSPLQSGRDEIKLLERYRKAIIFTLLRPDSNTDTS
jgi:hypothetical protein